MRIYWSTEQARVMTSDESDIPKDATSIPVWLFALLAPMLGAAFVVFLPFAGLAVMANAAIDVVKKRLERL